MRGDSVLRGDWSHTQITTVNSARTAQKRDNHNTFLSVVGISRGETRDSNRAETP